MSSHERLHVVRHLNDSPIVIANVNVYCYLETLPSVGSPAPVYAMQHTMCP